MSIKEHLEDLIFTKFSKYIEKHNAVEVINMDKEKQVTQVSLRRNDLLIKRTTSFCIKALVINIILSLLFYSKLADVIGNIASELADKVSIYTNTSFDLGLSLDLYFIGMASLIFISHIIILILLNETFTSHLYGYRYDPRKLKTQFRHSKCLAVITLSFLVLDEIYLFTQGIHLYQLLIIAVSISFISYMIFIKYRHIKNDIVCTFLVRGQNFKSTTRTDLVNGKSDIVINFKPGNRYKLKSIRVDIFNENIHIVENEDILVIGKTTGVRIFSKEEVKDIKINNHMGVDITVKYGDTMCRWKQI